MKLFIAKLVCVHVFDQCFYKQAYLEGKKLQLSSRKKAYKNSACIQMKKEEQELTRNSYNQTCCNFKKGHVKAQTVSRRLPIVVARVRSQFRSCRVCGGQNGTRECFLRVVVSPANSHTTKCSMLIHHPGLAQ